MINQSGYGDYSSEKILFLAQVNKKSDSHIISSKISDKGNFFAYSDSDNTVLFKYDFQNNEIKKLRTLKNFSSKFLFFTRNENFLILFDSQSKLHIYDIKKETFETHLIETLSSDEIILSCDYLEEKASKLFTFSTLNKNLHLFNLSEKKSSLLPTSDCFTSLVKFVNEKSLIAVGEDNKFLFINISEFKFDDWTYANMNNFPKNYLRWYNKIYGVTFKDSKYLLLYTDYNYIKVDLTEEIPLNSLIFRDKEDKNRNAEWTKKLRSIHRSIFHQIYKGEDSSKIEEEIFHSKSQNYKSDKENENFKITSRFSSILFLDYIDADTLLVVENDWNKILREFPETVAKFNYGS
jgi:hypothetical protein